MYCEKRKVFSLVLKDDRVEQCLHYSLVGLGESSKCVVQSKKKYQGHKFCTVFVCVCVCIVGFSACGCQKKSVVCEMECRHSG